MTEFRKIEAIESRVAGNEPGPAPEILFLECAQLVINEEYQRDLSASSLRLIRKMAADWDWCSFKAPNVARTDDPNIFEVVDGQHTAIAAATNGNVPFLPCLVMAADTLARKAEGFLGINTSRIALTKAAIYNARLAAQDEDAISVHIATTSTAVRILHWPPPGGAYRIGDTLAIGAMLDIAKCRGCGRLQTILRLAVAARAAPVTSALLKALDLALPVSTNAELLNRVDVTLRGQGCARLEMIAKSRTNRGARNFETLADIIADLAKLPGKRLGKK